MHGEPRKPYTISVGQPKGKRPFRTLSINGIILKWILGKHSGRMWTIFNWLKYGLAIGLCEHGNALSDYI